MQVVAIVSLCAFVFLQRCLCLIFDFATAVLVFVDAAFDVVVRFPPPPYWFYHQSIINPAINLILNSSRSFFFLQKKNQCKEQFQQNLEDFQALRSFCFHSKTEFMAKYRAS